MTSCKKEGGAWVNSSVPTFLMFDFSMLPVGGWWLGGSFGKSSHFVAPSCKLELARFSAYLRIQDGAECGKKEKTKRRQKQYQHH